MNVISPAGLAIARTSLERTVTRHEPARQRAANARPVVVLVDRSPEAANAVWRGGLVARDRGLPLHLIALQPLHANLAEAAARAERVLAAARLRPRARAVGEMKGAKTGSLAIWQRS